MTLRTSRAVVIASLGAALTLIGCNAVLGFSDGTLGDPAARPDTGVAVVDTGTRDTGSPDAGGDTGGDTAAPDSAPDVADTGVDAPPVFPEGGVAAAPIAGGLIAESPSYRLITSTTMGGGNGPPSSSKYSLHGGTVSVTPR